MNTMRLGERLEQLTITLDTTVEEHTTLANEIIDSKGKNVPLKICFNCENGAAIEIDTKLELNFY